MKAAPKYIMIKEEIISEISSGKLKRGDKLPVREELIRKYSVTRATLDKAFRELIRENWLTAKRKKGTFVSGPSEKRKVALVMNFPGMESAGSLDFFHQTDALKYILFSSFRDNMVLLEEKSVCRNIKLLSGYDISIWHAPPDVTLPRLLPFKHKVLVINRYYEGLNFVSTNHRGAVREATLKLIEAHGSQSQLVYLDLPYNSFISRERREGFFEACSEKNRFYRICRMSKDFEENVREVSSLKITADIPTVIISPSILLTGAVLKMAYMKGVQMGREFFYCDFDNADSLEKTGVSIPSILQDYEKMGMEAVKAVDKMQSCKNVSVFVPYKLVNM